MFCIYFLESQINNISPLLFQGFYKGGKFVFNFNVGPSYPHEPPKVKCETMVYHPNIDLEGNICLNILRYVYGIGIYTSRMQKREKHKQFVNTMYMIK